MEKEQFLSSIYIIIKDAENKILLQKRCGTKLWCGYWALPAGHVNAGENVYDALVREAKEELDITVDKKDIIDTFVVNRRNKTIKPYFDVYFEIEKYCGKLKINEPNKCSKLIWKKIDDLPTPIIEYEKEALLNNKKGIKFSCIDVDNK